MSVTDPTRTRYETDRRRDEQRVHEWRETKPSFMTTEFWAMLGGIVALAVIYAVADNPAYDLFDAALLCTIAGAAYIVSRGFAKSGSHDDNWRSERQSR